MTTDCLTISIEEAGRLLGYSRNSAYEAAKKGELPTIQLGHKMRVPRIVIERMLERAGQGAAVLIVVALPEDCDGRLIANGYEPIPVNGKRPVIDGWSTGDMTVERVRVLREAHPDHTNIGLRTGRLAAIDNDLHNPEHAAQINALASEVFFVFDPMERVGSKGAMLFYRNETPIPKIVVSGMAPGAKHGDKPEKIEILGVGQQCVAYGIHPETGKPYQWKNTEIVGEPLTRPLDDLSEITSADLRLFAERAAAKLTELGYIDVRISDRGDVKRNAAHHAKRAERPLVGRDDLIRELGYLRDPHMDRGEWFKVIAAIRATNLRGIDDPDAMDAELSGFACAWSRGEYTDSVTPGNYTGDDDVDTTFYSTDADRDGGCTFGTIDHMARAAGYVGPPPLSTSSETFATAVGKPSRSETNHAVHFHKVDAQPAAIDWAWRGYLALGKYHAIGAEKGAGKSTIAYDFGARLSCGQKWPDGSPAQVGDVVVWSGEDDYQDTILPRFLAAGGDQSRLHAIRDIDNDDGGVRDFDPAHDIRKLAEAMEDFPNTKLIIIDPIVSAVAGDSHKNAETRRGLQALVSLANDKHAALLGITHFTKGTDGKNPIERITGSLAFGAVARVVLGLAKGEDQDAVRRLVRIASNIGPEGGGFEYVLHQVPLPGCDFTAQQIHWLGQLRGSPRQLLSKEQKPSDLANAVNFLKTMLAQAGASGMTVRDLKAAAEAHSIAWRTIERAKPLLPIKPHKVIGEQHGGWVWMLPPEEAGGTEIPF